ncbi:MAG: GNAT family N-acetyltransferase [Bacteroidales bacterium]|nr:GNAT family N-acetyltransferase [Bacteroidales bacterium]
MSAFIFRNAAVEDVPFLVDTIVEAEKSGTDKLSYSTVFGLTEAETRKYLAEMLLEEIDGCELSISSFIIAEKKGTIAAAVAGWIEGIEGIPSSVLKGNLLNHILPRDAVKKAMILNPVLGGLHIENISNTAQLGLVYVSKEFRGMNLVKLLIDELIIYLKKAEPGLSVIYVQVFANNISAIKAYEKANFKVEMTKKSSNKEILKYLPSDQKILMKKELT